MAANNTPTSFDDLPGELASNILLRLPVKDLIRSTSVKKQWYSFISNPTFISAQIKRAISHCHDNAVLIIPPFPSQQKHCSLVSAETSKVIEKYEIPFTTRTSTLKLLSSVDGLMLLTDSNMFHGSRDLYLWNPCVRTHRTLVSSCFKKLFDNPIISYFICGLGFNQACNDYRVVRIVYAIDKNRKYLGEVNKKYLGEVAPKAEVYSLKKQTWKKIKDPVVPRVGADEGVYVKGSFFWLETIRPTTQGMCLPYNSKDLWMLTFDFDSEVFGELKVPEKVSNCLGVDGQYKLMEFEGSLALCVYLIQVSNGVTMYPYRVWLMRQDNGVISWFLRFKVVLNDGGNLLNITKAGTVLMETLPFWDRHVPNDVASILSCNLKSLHFKNLGISKHGGVESPLSGLEPSTANTLFMESLVMYEGGKLQKLVK